ncbi:MAG: amidohydrolase [Flavobacteriales bacterium]|nr:amidohydrolase [Flavobacteriales bacterium]MCB9174370.1 amidohydrolase [Flavobacteriales bacterium]
MKFSLSIFIALTIVLIGCGETPKIDLIVHNAKIYTVNESFDVVEAIAIDKGKIIAVGAENEIKNKYLAKEYLDAKQMNVYPGFIDAHCHLYNYAALLQELDLTGTSSFNQVLNKIETYSKTNTFEWILGRGWDQNDWDKKEFPNKEKLDELFPNTPIFLVRIDGHAALVNQKALDLAQISTNTVIKGGIIEQKNNQLTGILLDNAVDSLKKAIPVKDKKLLSEQLLAAQKNLFKVGLTTIDEAGLEKEQIDLLDELQQSNKMKLKIYAMISSSEELLEYYLKKGPYKTERLNVSSFKFYADGALGSRGACLLKPYSDIHTYNHYGLLINERAYFEKYAPLLYEKGFQMNTHCIGDSANEMVLSVYASVLKTTNDKRWRIEHAQVLDPSHYELYRNYTIIPSVQPTHATSDMYWAEDRVGSERIKHAYAYQQLLLQNGLIALGTDFPIEGINPINTFYAAVARKDAKGYPEGGFQIENGLSRQEALKGMTIWAALSNLEENEKGSLEIGKFADFVITDKDIMKVKENELLSTKVQYTYINGEKVYSAEN